MVRIVNIHLAFDFKEHLEAEHLIHWCIQTNFAGQALSVLLEYYTCID